MEKRPTISMDPEQRESFPETQDTHHITFSFRCNLPSLLSTTRPQNPSVLHLNVVGSLTSSLLAGVIIVAGSPLCRSHVPTSLLFRGLCLLVVRVPQTRRPHFLVVGLCLL